MPDKGESWLECRKDIYRLLEFLRRTGGKLRTDNVNLDKRMLLVETQCAECKNAKARRWSRWWDLLIGVGIGIILLAAGWLFHRGG